MIILVYGIAIITCFFAFDLWHQQEHERLLSILMNIDFHDQSYEDKGLVSAIEDITLYGISSEKAKNSIFENKVPGFYNYE